MKKPVSEMDENPLTQTMQTNELLRVQEEGTLDLGYNKSILMARLIPQIKSTPIDEGLEFRNGMPVLIPEVAPRLRMSFQRV